MSKMIDKQRLIDHLDEQANYFYEQSMVGVSGIFVILRDQIEAGDFDAGPEEETEQ